MDADLEITVAQLRFDQNECHANIIVSDDGQKARDWGGKWNSVLGSTPMSHGQHSWKMKGGGTCRVLGLSTKPSPTDHHNDYDEVAFCWHINDHCVSLGDGVSGSCSQRDIRGPSRDDFQLDLDCDWHTLQITSQSSGQTSTFSNVPDKEYFPYISLEGCVSIEFV